MTNHPVIIPLRVYLKFHENSYTFKLYQKIPVILRLILNIFFFSDVRKLLIPVRKIKK